MTLPKEHPSASADDPKRLTAYLTSPYPVGIVPAPASRGWMSATNDRFAYRCLPLLIANQSGWLVLNNFSFTASWSGHDGIDAVWIEYGRGASPPLAASHFGYGIITWTIPFLFRTPPGFNLLVRGPANWPKDGVYPLDGVVEADWASSTFTMNWKITRPDTPIRFELDEPIAMILPQRRGELEAFQPELQSIQSNRELRDRFEQWDMARRGYLTDLKSGTLMADDPGWQRHYFQGAHADGERGVETHQTKLTLRPFEQKHEQR